MPRPKKSSTGPKTINRKVFFYRVNAGVSPDTGQPIVVNFAPAIRHLNDLPFTPEGRYLDTDDNKQLVCWVDSTQPPFRLQLANVRRGQHPPVESAGNLSPLVLGRGSGLAEITHMVLFANGICGSEFNFYGPRASQMSFYFALKLQGLCPGFRLATVVRPDLEARLGALSDIRLIDLKVKASFESVLSDANEDLGAALRANIRAVNARPEDEFELTFVRKKNKKLVDRVVPLAIVEGVRKLARLPNLKEQVSIFKVSGPGGSGNQFVDILHEQFAAEKSITPALNDTGGVQSESMYAAIEEAYAEMQAELTAGSEVE